MYAKNSFKNYIWAQIQAKSQRFLSFICRSGEFRRTFDWPEIY